MLAICLASCKEAVSVVGAELNADGDLIITMSDGTAQNLGKVKGADGQNGSAADNPLCLEFYPLPDGSYAVSLGNAIMLETVAIPATYNGKAVTTVIANASESPTSVKTVTLPDSIVTIGKNAFSGYESLESINIPSSVTSIGDMAFAGCRNLNSVTIPNGMTSIGDRAFEWCRKFTDITIPSSVTSIGEGAFNWCTSLKSVTFSSPDGWSVGNAFNSPFRLSATDLRNPNTAADFITNKYTMAAWIKATE